MLSHQNGGENEEWIRRKIINEKRSFNEGLIEVRGVHYIIPINCVIGVHSRVVSSIRHIGNVLEDVAVFIHEWSALCEQVKHWNTHSLILEISLHPRPSLIPLSVVSFTQKKFVSPHKKIKMNKKWNRAWKETLFLSKKKNESFFLSS